MRRRTVFADTFYWLAVIDDRDDWHARVRAIGQALGNTLLLTTDEVLVEVLNAFADRRASLRQFALATVQRLLAHPNTQVIPQSRETFDAGLELYARRPDKGYSLTDCISMQTMRQHGVTEVLTHDHHFAQEGFVLLLRA